MLNDFDILNIYEDWNTRLFRHFFPQGTENPILYLDDLILKNIMYSNEDKSPEDCAEEFMRIVFLNEEKLKCIERNWNKWTGRHDTVNFNYRWEKWARFLIDKRFQREPKIPAYFVILCGIMYLACRFGPQHGIMKLHAKIYMETTARNQQIGGLIERLMTQLHQDVPSFDADRMICGTGIQKNMSRIKFHTVLRAKEREDLIDFLEVNNLKWEYGSYTEYVNERLIPALNAARKTDFVNLVKDPSCIPYVKSLLQSPLDWGKKATTEGNQKQTAVYTWYYELYFDYDGTPTFYIVPNGTLPFMVKWSLKEGFNLEEGSLNVDYLGERSSFERYEPAKWEETYVFQNVATDDWDKVVFFEQTSSDSYRQVARPLEGTPYLILIHREKLDLLSKNQKAKLKNWMKYTEWNGSSEYVAYETKSYTAPKRISDPLHDFTPNDREALKDEYSIYGKGSWYSMNLHENESVYWKHDWLHTNEPDADELKLPTVKGKNGKSYVHIPQTSKHQIGGSLFIRKNKTNKEVERIVHSFQWKQHQTSLYWNRWGEISTEDLFANAVKPQCLLKRTLAASWKDQPQPHTDMLIQILHDIADEKGCVRQKDMVSTLNFVLEFFGIVPTKDNRRSLIYALRRLGYITSYYNPLTKEYQNQLNAPYLERTHSCITTGNNAYLVKGVYDEKELRELLNQSQAIRYKRPYEEEHSNKLHPEYVCLPDQILLQLNAANVEEWTIYEQPIGHHSLEQMAGVCDFSKQYMNTNLSDLWRRAAPEKAPCMVKDEYNKEVLCTQTQENGEYRIYKVYKKTDGSLMPIPKHWARAYCQMQHKQPVCWMSQDPNRQLNYGKIMFLHGMAKPGLLDLALCDLNMGLPTSGSYFLVDMEKHGYQDNRLLLEGVTYSTQTYDKNNTWLKQALEKVSGQTVQDFNHTSAIKVARNPNQILYKMKWVKRNMHLYSLCLYSSIDHSLVAFSEGKDRVYYRPTGEERFYEVQLSDGSSSINKKLSAILTKGNFTLNQTSREEPQLETETSAPIHILMENNLLNNQ